MAKFEDTIPPQSDADALIKHPLEATAIFLDQVRTEGAADPFDMLTLRKTRGHRISSDQVLQFAHESNYKRVYFAFCRSPHGVPLDKVPKYDSANTIPLDTPIVVPWSQRAISEASTSGAPQSKRRRTEEPPR